MGVHHNASCVEGAVLSSDVVGGDCILGGYYETHQSFFEVKKGD